MPDVSLFTASEPLTDDVTVSIRYTVEVDGLPAYTELYDVRKLARGVETDRERAVAAWTRRLDAPIENLKEPKFSAKVTAQLHEDEAG